MDPTLFAISAGAAAAGCFGVGDYLSRGITHCVGWARTFLWVQVVSFFPLVGIAWTTTEVASVAATDILAVLALGTCNAAGIVGLYRSFEEGVLSVVSPIASTFAAVTVTWALLFGHSLGAPLMTALGVTLVGVLLVSRDGEPSSQESSGNRGVYWALLSALCFGTVFFFLEPVTARLGPVWPIAGLRVCGAAFAGGWLLRNGQAAGDKSRAPLPWGTIAAVAALDSGGMVVYAAGTQAGEVAIVAVLASCFSAITVFLAHAFIGERLARWQWVGLVLLLCGVAWTTWQGTQIR